jgi:hypothetical protein
MVDPQEDTVLLAHLDQKCFDVRHEAIAPTASSVLLLESRQRYFVPASAMKLRRHRPYPLGRSRLRSGLVDHQVFLALAQRGSAFRPLFVEFPAAEG